MLIKVMIALLIIACIAPMVIKGPDGEPLMSIEDWIPSTPTIPDELQSDDEPTTVYKWQDEDGNWHFSNTPAQAQAGAEKLTIDSSSVNTVQAVKVPKSGLQTTGGSTPQIPSALDAMSPDNVQELLKNVNNLQEVVDQRKAEIDKRTGNN